VSIYVEDLLRYLDLGHRHIDTDDTGRVDKAKVLQALQSKGESYDRARETLKHVSVDASGKVELEDWVEVRTGPLMMSQDSDRNFVSAAECQATRRTAEYCIGYEGWESYCTRLKRQCQPYDQRG
jgi:hypothetical protein